MQVLSKPMWHNSQYLNLYCLWNPPKDTNSTDELLAA